MKIPRVLLCAGASGSGKTLLTCGILQVLKNRGLRTASFKCGPDYIDPMFHTKVIGTKSRNLDTFFTDGDVVRYLLAKNSCDMDIAVMEGVMGYYDGVGGITSKASAYELANVTETPAVLIVNCRGMSVSVLPYIKGFAEYKKDSRIAGVILNQMTAMLYPRVKKMIEEELSIPVLGYVPKVEDCVLESRHLGLVMPEEVEGFREKLMKLAGILEQTLCVDKILEIAGNAPNISPKRPWKEDSAYAFCLPEKVRIGIARDEAFCFVYEDNLKLLEQMGAEIVYFSPIQDKRLPEGLCGLIFYGGYPELLGKELEDNYSVRRAILAEYQRGIPVLAECGGFMYLHESMEDMDKNPCDGVGIIPGHAYKTEKLGRFGYVTLTQREGTVFGKRIGKSPAHEFHYFDSTSCGEDFLAEKPMSSRSWSCLHASDHLLAGFPHFYYYGNPKLPQAFLEKCLEYRRTGK